LNEHGTRVTKFIPILNIDCPTCTTLLEKEVEKLKGVEEARVNYMNKTVRVKFDPELVGLADVEKVIERLGYRIAYKEYSGFTARLRKLFQKKNEEDLINVTDAEFPSKVLHASKPVVVLFSSPNCPACQAAKAILRQVSKELGKRASFYCMNVTSSETWRRYSVSMTPSLFIFGYGQVKKVLSNELPRKEEIVDALHD